MPRRALSSPHCASRRSAMVACSSRARGRAARSKAAAAQAATAWWSGWPVMPSGPKVSTPTTFRKTGASRCHPIVAPARTSALTPQPPCGSEPVSARQPGRRAVCDRTALACRKLGAHSSCLARAGAALIGVRRPSRPRRSELMQGEPPGQPHAKRTDDWARTRGSAYGRRACCPYRWETSLTPLARSTAKSSPAAYAASPAASLSATVGDKTSSGPSIAPARCGCYRLGR
jgi:hypothetical protein